MIIDFHTHVFPDKIAGPTVRALGENCHIPSYSSGTVDGLLSALDEGGVDIAINLPAITKPSQFDSVLKFADQLNRRTYETSRIISFAGMHPDCEDIEEKMAQIKALGFKGIKLHPDYQGHYIDDEGYIRIIKAAKQNGLIALTHAGLDGAYIGQPIKCTPRRVLHLLDEVGGYDKLVLAHYGGNELFDDVLESIAGEDVYLDTAYILPIIGEDAFKRILDKHGDDRILFATDSPWRCIKDEVERLKSFNLEKATEEKIFYKNAKRLLGI